MREGTAKEQQRGLQHQRQKFHHVVEIPCNDAVEFPLPVLAAFNCGSSEVGRRIPVQPLFAEHRKEGGEECGGEACEEDGLDLDYRAGRTCPLWECRRVVSEGGVVKLVDKDTEEGCSYVVRILLEVGVDLDDECGGDGGEQTSLSPPLAHGRQTRYETHEYESGVQILVVLLHELLVVFLSLLAVVLEELRPVILLGRWYILSPTPWISATSWLDIENLPICLLSAVLPWICVPYMPLSTVLATLESQK